MTNQTDVRRQMHADNRELLRGKKELPAPVAPVVVQAPPQEKEINGKLMVQLLLIQIITHLDANRVDEARDLTIHMADAFGVEIKTPPPKPEPKPEGEEVLDITPT